MIRQVSVETPGQGLHEITSQVASLVESAAVHEGLCTLFLRHTSASLVIRAQSPARTASLGTSAEPAPTHTAPAWIHAPAFCASTPPVGLSFRNGRGARRT